MNNLNYNISGSGRTLIFQHGLGANLEQAQDLAGKIPGWQVVSMDCPGHGKSLITGENFPSFANYTENLVRLMDSLKIDRAVFGGISMGSGISLSMAIHHPDRVEGLILVRPAWLAEKRPPNLEILLKLVPFLTLPNGQAEFEKLAEFQTIVQILPSAAKSILGQFTRDQGEATETILTRMVNDAPFENLSELHLIRQPAVVIANDDDPLHPLDMGKVIAKELPKAKFQKVTSRYMNNEKHTSEVRKIIASFLNQIKNS